MSNSNLLMRIGVTDEDAKVDVYRDGDVVTLVARGHAERETDHGKVRTRGVISQQYDSIAAFEHERDRLLKRFPLAYAKVVGRLGIDTNVRSAPPLPPSLRGLLPEHVRALPQSTSATSAPDPMARVAVYTTTETEALNAEPSNSNPPDTDRSIEQDDRASGVGEAPIAGEVVGTVVEDGSYDVWLERIGESRTGAP